MEQNTVNLSQEQMQQAATAGAQLLQTPGAVSIPSTMAITGIIGMLNALLTAIANGQVIVVNVPQKQIPEGEIPPNGDGAKEPDITPIEGGKKAEG